MEKENVAKILRKIDVVRAWYNNGTCGEYHCSNQYAQDLIEELDEVK